MPASPPSGLPALYQRTEGWFQRASAALLGQLPCRAGCFRCCVGPFPITILDHRLLRQGLAGLTSARREHISQRAAEQTAALEQAYPRLTESPFLDTWPDEEIDRLVTQFHALPCPALRDDGLCELYGFRPLACRSMGVPADEGPLTQGACEVQTFVPIVRLSASLRAEEDELSRQEARALAQCRRESPTDGEELLSPYGFLPLRISAAGPDSG